MSTGDLKGPEYEDLVRDSWTHTDLITGVERHWKQENESDVTTKQEAIGMIQRTLNFWVIKLRDDILVQVAGTSQEEAESAAVISVSLTLQEMLTLPFTSRFGITSNDFTIHFSRSR